PRIRGASGSRPRTPVMTFPSPTKLKGLRCWRVLLALLIAGAASLAAAQERPRRPPAPASEHHAEQGEQHQGEARGSVLRLLPADSVTEHALDIPGGKLAYTATAGTLSLFDQSGERSAAIYYTAFVAKNAAAGNRPITFAFNGGPGAASPLLPPPVVRPPGAPVPRNHPPAAGPPPHP